MNNQKEVQINDLKCGDYLKIDNQLFIKIDFSQIQTTFYKSGKFMFPEKDQCGVINIETGKLWIFPKERIVKHISVTTVES